MSSPPTGGEGGSYRYRRRRVARLQAAGAVRLEPGLQTRRSGVGRESDRVRESRRELPVEGLFNFSPLGGAERAT